MTGVLPQPAEGTYVDFRQLDEVVGRALLLHFALAYRTAVQVHDLTALAALGSANFTQTDNAVPDLVQVGGSIWGWFRFSTAAPSDTVILPADTAASDPGRWHRQVLPSPTDCGTTRYYQHLELVHPSVTTNQLIDRCKGKTPALFVAFVGDDPEEVSQTLAFYRVKADFRLRVVAANFHGGVTARYTPPHDGDPGVSRCIGDLRDYLVKNNRLSGTLGVLHTKILGHRTVEERDAERLQVDSLDLRLVLNAWTPSLPCELKAPWELWLQQQDLLGRNVGPPNQVGAPT